MNPILKKAFLLTLLCLSGLLGSIQPVKGQSSLHDSLKHLLTYFQHSTKDEKLKQVIKEAQALYTSDRVDESLAKKILDVSDLLAHGSQPNQPKLFSYAQTLVLILEKLPPQKEHPSYATNINNLASLYKGMGQCNKPLPLYQHALVIRRKVLGEEHSDYAKSLNSVALLYNNLSNPAAASPLLVQASNIKLKYLNRTYATLSEQKKLLLL